MGRPFTYSKILAGVSSGAVFFSVQANSVSAVGEATFNHAQDYLKSLCKVDFKGTEEVYWHWVDFCVDNLVKINIFNDCAEFLRDLVGTDNLKFFKEIKSLEELEKKLKDFKKTPREERHSGRTEVRDLLPKIVKNIEDYFLNYLKDKPREKLSEYSNRFTRNMALFKALFSNLAAYGYMNFAESWPLVKAVYFAERGQVTIDLKNSKLIFSSDIVFNKTRRQCSGFWANGFFCYSYYKAGEVQKRFPINVSLWKWILKTIEENNRVSAEDENLVKDKGEEKNEDKINLTVPKANEQKNSEEEKDKEFLNKKRNSEKDFVSKEQFAFKIFNSKAKIEKSVSIESPIKQPVKLLIKECKWATNQGKEENMSLHEDDEGCCVEKIGEQKSTNGLKGINVWRGSKCGGLFTGGKNLFKLSTLGYSIDMDSKNKLPKVMNKSEIHDKKTEIGLEDKKKYLCELYELGREYAFSAKKIESGLKYETNRFIPSLPFFNK